MRIAVQKNINLHCHTLLSDGSLSPIELISQAYSIGLRHIAVTDHHTVDSFSIITNWLKDNNHLPSLPFFWSGIEISCLLKGCLVHLIGLGFNTESEFIKPYILGDAPNGNFLQANVAVKSIHEAGGISILAHPARYRLPYSELIKEAFSIGFDGVEVWYDYDMSVDWRPSRLICNSINSQVTALQMLKSCGTDTHGLSLLGR